MAKNNKMPAIRFSGYTDTWEQRKLSELATMNARIGWQNLRTSEFLDSGDYLLITGTDFDNGRIKYNTCHYVEKKRFDQDTKIQLSTGSILITKDGTLGKVALIEELPKPATLNAGVFNVRVKDDAVLSYKYLYHYLKAPFLMKYVTANATGGTIKHLNQSILVDFPIPITEKQEQDRIAKLLDSLESIITLHQRKLEKLKLTKKALLQKLFPQNGSKFPELRFKGFTAAWEQCKLSDITEIVMGQSPSSKNYTDNPNDNILVQGNADLKDGKVVPRLWTKEITKTIDKDGIVLTVRAPVGDVAKTDYKVVLGRGVAGIKGNDYIYQFLQKLQNNRYWVSLSSGSTFESINSNDIKDLIIDIPSIEEQTKISMLLNNVNSIITLHQRKLEMLKNVKKGLLQKMFV